MGNEVSRESDACGQNCGKNASWGHAGAVSFLGSAGVAASVVALASLVGTGAVSVAALTAGTTVAGHESLSAVTWGLASFTATLGMGITAGATAAGNAITGSGVLVNNFLLLAFSNALQKACPHNIELGEGAPPELGPISEAARHASHTESCQRPAGGGETCGQEECLQGGSKRWG